MSPLALDALLASVHHLFVFALVAVLFAELVLISGVADAARMRQLGRLDSKYGLLSMGVIAAGFLRAVYGTKGWSYYLHNHLFWLKIGLFIVVGLLSIVPTVRFIRWRKESTLPDVSALQATRQWILMEVAVLALIPIAAILMARGIGY
jgi:putative membrane protein